MPPHSGTIPRFDNPSLQAVWEALNRAINVNLMTELYNGLQEKDRRPPLSSESRIAFGFDTNAIFRLGLGPQGANALDYLGESHDGPVIVPGQAIQEIWNNFLSGVEPKAKGLAKKLLDLESEMNSMDQELGPLGEAARTAVQALIEFHGDWTDPSSLAVLDGTLKTLLAVASVPQVPREEFYHLGQIRKETKTPPGFRDDFRNYGDYYIWADFLFGLATVDLTSIDAVVFVTNDQKQDWSRNGVPHPVLVAEVRQISGKDFRIWTLDNFRSHVKKIAS